MLGSLAPLSGFHLLLWHEVHCPWALPQLQWPLLLGALLPLPLDPFLVKEWLAAMHLAAEMAAPNHWKMKHWRVGCLHGPACASGKTA